MNINLINPSPSVALADHARRLKASGIPIIELQTGDPDFHTPTVIVNAANSALREGKTHYIESGGLPQLRQCLAESLNREFGTSLQSENILVTHGATQGLAAIISALVELDDEVIVLEPNWITLDSLITLNGGRVVKVTHVSDDEQLLACLDSVKTSRTTMLCFNSPNNPTGSVFRAERVARLVDWAECHGLYIVSDEVYRAFTYDVPHASVMKHLPVNDRLLFVDSFSKRYAMTGWRVGFVVGHQDLISRVSKASQVMITNVAPFVQYGALAALQSQDVADVVQEMKREYKERRDTLSMVCNLEGLRAGCPEGAFYLFLNVGGDDTVFARQLLNDSQICVVPGSVYGPSGVGHLRLSFASSLRSVLKGLQKIGEMQRSRDRSKNYWDGT
jgi:aspartate aminotransferase